MIDEDPFEGHSSGEGQESSFAITSFLDLIRNVSTTGSGTKMFPCVGPP